MLTCCFGITAVIIPDYANICAEICGECPWIA
jgi:hypothetical protein